MKAYTLIEILIVIAVLMILTGLASLSLVSFGKSNDVDTSRTIVTGALREARGNAMAVVDNHSWGVHLEANRVTIFPDDGTGYQESNNLNSVSVMATKTNISWSLNGGAADIVFNKRTGSTDQSGTITLSGTNSNDLLITVNQEGLIENQ